MKLRSPWLIQAAALLLSWLMRAWRASLRARFAYLDGQFHLPDPRGGRFLYAFWHEDVLLCATLRGTSRVHALISRHADGELIARTAEHLGIGTVRGSTTRGGMQALRELLAISRKTHLTVTPDGPKGPRRTVQSGVIFLAAQTGLPIVPLTFGYARAWRAKSWDKFAIALPGTDVTIVFSDAIRVPRGLDRGQMESYRRLLEERLTAASEAAQRWATGGPKPRAERALPAAA